MPKSNFYAIRTGKQCNVIVDSWDKCSELVIGFKGAEFKGFTKKIRAEKYIAGKPADKSHDLSMLQKRISSIEFKNDIAELGDYLELELSRLKESVKSHSTKTVRAHATNLAATAILIAELAAEVKG